MVNVGKVILFYSKQAAKYKAKLQKTLSLDRPKFSSWYIGTHSGKMDS